MVPWERFVLIDLIQQYITEQDQKRRDAANAKKDIQRSLQRINGSNNTRKR
jgi:hypothetical protein